MGRIGKSYPRFGDATAGVSPPAQRRPADAPALGAIIGILAGLALIGWVLTR